MSLLPPQRLGYRHLQRSLPIPCGSTKIRSYRLKENRKPYADMSDLLSSHTLEIYRGFPLLMDESKRIYLFGVSCRIEVNHVSENKEVGIE